MSGKRFWWLAATAVAETIWDEGLFEGKLVDDVGEMSSPHEHDGRAVWVKLSSGDGYEIVTPAMPHDGHGNYKFKIVITHVAAEDWTPWEGDYPSPSPTGDYHEYWMPPLPHSVLASIKLSRGRAIAYTPEMDEVLRAFVRENLT